MRPVDGRLGGVLPQLSGAQRVDHSLRRRDMSRPCASPWKSSENFFSTPADFMAEAQLLRAPSAGERGAIGGIHVFRSAGGTDFAEEKVAAFLTVTTRFGADA